METKDCRWRRAKATNRDEGGLGNRRAELGGHTEEWDGAWGPGPGGGMACVDAASSVLHSLLGPSVV